MANVPQHARGARVTRALCAARREPLFFDGRRCTYWVSWAPQRAQVGVCVTVFTAAGEMRCSVSADSSCVPDPGRLVELFEAEFGAMAEATGWGACKWEDKAGSNQV